MLFEFRHHQEGPDYDTKAAAEAAAAEWDGQGGAIAHVEPVQGHRDYKRDATT